MFKFVVLCAFVAAASAIPPRFLRPFFDDNPLSTYAGKSLLGDGSYAVPQSHGSSDDVHAEIRSYDSDVRANGFHYSFETTNNIKADATGDADGNIHGDFEWVSPEGEHIDVHYVADENGYQPNSAVLPTPHPIPEAILKSLAYIAAHPPKDTPHQEHN